VSKASSIKIAAKSSSSIDMAYLIKPFFPRYPLPRFSTESERSGTAVALGRLV
jgi:hypothetical protein